MNSATTIALASVAVPAAQPLPGDLAAALREWGPRWGRDIGAARDAMVQAWSAVLQAAPPAPPQLAADRPYGADPRQVLDVYAPAGARGAPVLVFVHGGAFVRGDKRLSAQIYANVPIEFARHGYVAVNVEYRLAPQAPWPAGAQDVRDALALVAREAASWGGDPARIFLMGHSAGCAHCATAAWDDRVRPPGGLPIAGLVLVSPRAGADVRPDNPNAAGVRAYYGADEALYADREPMGQVRADAPPTFIASARYENPQLEYQAFELAHRLARQADAGGGPLPRFVQLAEHNHVSIVAQFDTPYNTLGIQIRDWCGRIQGGQW